MIHPLVKVLVSRPDLLAAHIASYGSLVAAQAGEAAAQLRTRAVLVGAAVLGLALAVAFGGGALLLLAVIPLATMPMPWLLIAVPAVPLGVALACFASLQGRPVAWSLDLLRDQIAADAALLREASPP